MRRQTIKKKNKDVLRLAKFGQKVPSLEVAQMSSHFDLCLVKISDHFKKLKAMIRIRGGMGNFSPNSPCNNDGQKKEEYVTAIQYLLSLGKAHIDNLVWECVHVLSLYISELPVCQMDPCEWVVSNNKL